MTKEFIKEYTDDVVEPIEFLYGKDYLSQGGESAVDRMLDGFDLTNKVIADIGCGTGGPLIHIARNYPIASAVGVDVDADLLDRAGDNSADISTLEWVHSVPEKTLPLDDNSVDIIIGKESWLHIADKLAFFKDLHRILKPGGQICCIDWMHRSADYSNMMNSFVHADGLSFHLTTVDEYLDLIKAAGFQQLQSQENSDEALAYSRMDVEKLCTPSIRDEFIARFGQEALDAWLSSWLMQCEVFASGQMQTFFIKAEK